MGEAVGRMTHPDDGAGLDVLVNNGEARVLVAAGDLALREEPLGASPGLWSAFDGVFFVSDHWGGTRCDRVIPLDGCCGGDVVGAASPGAALNSRYNGECLLVRDASKADRDLTRGINLVGTMMVTRVIHA